MKTTSLLTALILIASAAGSLAAEETTAAKEGCKMMAKKEPAPEPACSCKKMMTKEEPAKPDIESLIEKMKTARGDQALDAFAAVLNQMLADRKAAQDKAPEAPAAEAPAHAEHHH